MIKKVRILAKAPNGKLEILNIGGKRARDLAKVLKNRGYKVDTKSVKPLELTYIHATRR